MRFLTLKHKYPWSMMASIYITQYLGLAFIMSAAFAILRQQGIALDKLALLNLVALPLIGKVFYAPLIDNLQPFLSGKYRSWLLLAQSTMVITLLAAGSLNIQEQFTWVMVSLVFYVLAVSVQDIAIDGLACKLFDDENRKAASSVQFSGNLMGNIIGGGIILMLYPWLDWQGSLWLLAGLTAISLLQIVLFNEPQEQTEKSQDKPIFTSLFNDCRKFVVTHKHWFFVIALYPIGSTCGFALLNPLLVDQGWQISDIGFVMKIYGSIVGLISALLATPLIAYLGKNRALVTSILIQAIAVLCILPITLGYSSKFIVYLAIGIHFISFPFLLVTSATMMMDKAAQQQQKATFFTLQFSVASFLGFVYSTLTMTIAKHIGYNLTITFGVVITFLIAFISHLLLKQIKQNINSNNHLEIAHSGSQ